MEKLVVRSFIYPALLTAPSPLSFMDQYAFRPTGSTTAAIIALLHKVTTLLNTHPYVIVISLDFSKAFDTMRHATLMEKYSMLDLHDCVYNWIHGFSPLMNIVQFLPASNHHFSELMQVYFKDRGWGRWVTLWMRRTYAHVRMEMISWNSPTILISLSRLQMSTVDQQRCSISKNGRIETISNWTEANLRKFYSSDVYAQSEHSNSTGSAGVPRVKRIKLLGVTIADNFLWMVMWTLLFPAQRVHYMHWRFSERMEWVKKIFTRYSRPRWSPGCSTPLHHGGDTQHHHNVSGSNHSSVEAKSLDIIR